MARQRKINIRLSDAEHEQILMLAGQVKLTLSEYMRRCSVRRKISTQVDQQSVKALLAVNADLARLGNLMHLTITEFSDEFDSEIVNKLISDSHVQLHEIRDTQELLKQSIRKLSSSI